MLKASLSKKRFLSVLNTENRVVATYILNAPIVNFWSVILGTEKILKTIKASSRTIKKSSKISWVYLLCCLKFLISYEFISTKFSIHIKNFSEILMFNLTPCFLQSDKGSSTTYKNVWNLKSKSIKGMYNNPMTVNWAFKHTRLSKLYFSNLLSL